MSIQEFYSTIIDIQDQLALIESVVYRHFFFISSKGQNNDQHNFLLPYMVILRDILGQYCIVVLSVLLIMWLVNCWLRRSASNRTQTRELLHHLLLHLYSQHLIDLMPIIKVSCLQILLMMNVIFVSRKATRRDNVRYCGIELYTNNPLITTTTTSSTTGFSTIEV